MPSPLSPQCTRGAPAPCTYRTPSARSAPSAPAAPSAPSTPSTAELRSNMAALSVAPVQSQEYYKVPFEQALDLMAKRHVFLADGFAYVQRKMLISVVQASFRAKLSLALVHTFKMLPHVAGDDRVTPMLKNISNLYVGPDFKKGGVHGKISPGQIDALAQQSFPMCMKAMHQALRQDHGLKYSGRVIYGLFLKGIGLELEDALAFWRAEYTRIIPVDKFDREYAYGIRFNYGKEGKGTNYSPFGCTKIIKENPGQGQYHGCPYKTFNQDQLREMLRKSGVGMTETTDIVQLAKVQHYQVACIRTFEALHKGAVIERVGTHPNSYFDESVAHWKAKEGGVIPQTPAAASSLATPSTADTRMSAATPATDAEMPDAGTAVQPRNLASEMDKAADEAIQA